MERLVSKDIRHKNTEKPATHGGDGSWPGGIEYVLGV